MSQLPPPPGRPADDPDPTSLPGWRRASIGWVTLHVLIGTAMVIALLWVELGAVASFGRDLLRVQNVANNDGAMLRASAVVVVSSALAGLGGWLMFVYVRSSTRVRGLILALCLGTAFAISVAVLTPLLRPIPS